MSQTSDSKIMTAVTAAGKEVPAPVTPELYRSGAHRLYAAVVNMRRMSETRRLLVSASRAR